MARVTVEDCITVVPNRFELVLLAAQRARDISAGMELTVSRDNDKNPVVALREIAEQTIDFDELRRHIARGVNRHEDLNLEDDALLALAQESFPGTFNDAEQVEIAEVEFEEDKPAEATEASSEPTMEDIESIKEELGEENVAAEEVSDEAKLAVSAGTPDAHFS